MSRRNRVIVATLWIASLFAVGAVAFAQSQLRAYTPLAEPRVITGSDVGFRVEGMTGEVPTGTVVIRVNGRWVEASLSKIEVRR